MTKEGALSPAGAGRNGRRGAAATGAGGRSPGPELPAAAAWSFPRKSRSEEHTSELQSLMRISYAVFCLKKKKKIRTKIQTKHVKRTHHTHLNRHQLESAS